MISSMMIHCSSYSYVSNPHPAAIKIFELVLEFKLEVLTIVVFLAKKEEMSTLQIPTDENFLHSPFAPNVQTNLTT